MINKALFSSANMCWNTPKNLYNILNEEFKFDLDAATDSTNPLNTQYFFTPEDDALTSKWFGNVFLNPPYGRHIYKWIEKAFNERNNCNVIVLLIPSRTDTKYWHDFIMKAYEIRFIKGRLKFGDGKNPAPFPSCVVIFKKGNYTPRITSMVVKKQEAKE